ncbi:MAG: class I SAM-dependent methyltransferase [Anaerolineaceae bacterium]|nr:class I SAM-dependent methyltransferase [Anaerolineaceae bacterium]
MIEKTEIPELKLLPIHEYAGVNELDPIKYYTYPVFGKMYRKRVELCLSQCNGGEKILEIGFGTGLTFINLNSMYKEIHGLDLTVEINKVGELFKRHGVKTYLKNGSVLTMPYDENTFDTVLLISILEHLKPDELTQAFSEIYRVLKPGGQVIYGVPVEREFMVFMFRLLGHNIRDEHFSTEEDVYLAAKQIFQEVKRIRMFGIPSFMGEVYQIGHFVK